MTFQKTVLTVAIVILLLVLIVVGLALYKKKYAGPFPPVIGDCPDYWISKNNGTDNLCLNVKNLGRAECPKSMNFNQSNWTGSNGLCNKSKWARACDLTWDGVTNNVDACKK